MTRSAVDALFGALPVGLSKSEALGTMAGVVRRVFRIAGLPSPGSFADVDQPVPDSADVALSLLSKDVCSPELLGRVWEHLIAADARRVQGAHFTPDEAADRVVRMTFDAQRCWERNSPLTAHSVWDPAAGGGAFLLAAAREIERRSNHGRGEIVATLHATDIDPVALRVCDAALNLWCAGAARPVTALGDALLDLPDAWPRSFTSIVGNPPFLGQLTLDTARSAKLATKLKAEYGAVASGYVDQAALFVELGLRRLAPGGGLGMILPQSFLGTRDAMGVRSSAADRANLVSVWVDDAAMFDAAIEVIAIALSARETNEVIENPVTMVAMGSGTGIAVPTPGPRSWAPLLAAVQGVPVVPQSVGALTVADKAQVTAGFRQHFYGIADAVMEHDARPASKEVEGALTHPRLVTSGAIDPLASLWGRRPVKFAGKKWSRPVLALSEIADPAVRQWFGDRLVPKLLLASQTPILEVLVDPVGDLVPSVPVISVEPSEPEDIWHLAAAITAPSACAILVAAAAGTGLSTTAVRVRAQSIGELQLPEPSAAWDTGADAARAASDAWNADDKAGYTTSLHDLAVAMVDAYGGDPELVSWWASRVKKSI